MTGPGPHTRTMSTRDRVLDWRPSTHTEQNARHRLAALDCYTPGAARSAIKRAQPLNLDQGTEGACTGFGLAHVLAATPKPHTDLDGDVARALYHQARREDEWVGEDYDGSSVNGAMRAGRTLGWVSSWRWITTAGELRHALSYHGAVEAGSSWLAGMWEPDTEGFLNPTGAEVGGHAYCVSGYRPAPDRGATAVDYWIDNSWGPSWGLDGGAWIRDVDAYGLWFLGGELAVPTKLW